MRLFNGIANSQPIVMGGQAQMRKNDALEAMSAITNARWPTVLALIACSHSQPDGPKTVSDAGSKYATVVNVVLPASPAPEDCPKGMLGVPGGAYRFGRRDAGLVAAGPFCLDTTEVTTDAYASCVSANGCTEPVAAKNASDSCNWRRPGAGQHPINCIDWSQADSYCHWAGKRLPTEEEWEWAARGGERALMYPWGSEPPDSTRANACDPECMKLLKSADGSHKLDLGTPIYETTDRWPATAPVGSFPRGKSPFGFSDLAGNVREWTSSDAGGRYAGRARVIRGGSWLTSFPEYLRANSSDIEGNAGPPGAEDGVRCAR